MKIRPARLIGGSLELPGDKSISHRAAMIAAIASGDTIIANFAASADCRSTLDVLRGIGVDIEADGTSVKVCSLDQPEPISVVDPLDCGNSGTTMRLFAGVAAGLGIGCTLSGDKSLSKRPMRRVIEPLSKMGAEIGSEDGFAPLKIVPGRGLASIEYHLPVASAQIKSSILLAGLHATGTTTVNESEVTRDHTERMLRHFGCAVSVSTDDNGNRISVNGPTQLISSDLRVPGDISAAAFFAVAVGVLGGSMTLPGVGVNPTRTAVLDVLRNVGIHCDVQNKREFANEPVGDLSISVNEALKRTDAKFSVRGAMVANLIDEIPILAVLATQVEGGIEFRDAAELRVKESDRITAVVDNLRRMGADVEEFPDGLRVERSRLKGAVIESFGDHRIAMAFAVAGLVADGETTINGHKCVDVSYPGFFDSLESVIVR